VENKQWHFDTLAVQGGQEPDPATGALAVPIYQTTSYYFEDTEHAARLYTLDEPGYIYSRINNPTVRAFERRLALLEGGADALAVASGQSATLIAILNLAQAGDHIVAASSLYGGTLTLFNNTLSKLGLSFSFVPVTEPAAFADAVRPNTKAIYVETIGNPALDVPDFAALAQVAAEAGVPLVVDNTFASPWLCRPLELGAEVVVHSTTKYIGGHGTTIGGAIVSAGKFDWGNGKFPALATPDAAHGGLIYSERFGPAAFIAKARAHLLSDLGPAMSPFNAFLMLQGLETLHLRMPRHCQNAIRVADYLKSQPKVSFVTFPGLPEHRCHALAERYLNGQEGRGYGAMIGFGVRGGLAAGRRFIEALRLTRHVANVGDAKSLAIHPASTTHGSLTPEQRLACGISEDFIRFSVGIEHPDDIIADVEQALSRA
jgi:O-acetylhomoserine (thiol)-lyase